MDTLLKDSREHKIAKLLLNILRNKNIEEYNFFLSFLEREELARACIDVRNYFDWNFKYKKFQAALLIYDYFPLEFLWNLHIFQVLPLETYISNICMKKDILQNFVNALHRLFMKELEKNDAEYLVQTGILSFFINKAFPVISTADCDENIKEVSLQVVKSLLKGILTLEADKIESKRFFCFLALWNAGILEEASLLHFCLYAVDFYLSSSPCENDLFAFEYFENVLSAISPSSTSFIIEKLLKTLNTNDIISTIKSAVQKNEVNITNLLAVTKNFLQTHASACACLSTLISDLMNDAFEKSSQKTLLRCFFISYQVSFQPKAPLHINYKLWLQNMFRECGYSKHQNSYVLLIQALSDIVPFQKNIDCIKVAIESNFSVPPEIQNIYADYIILLKTRIQDLKPSSKPEDIVEKSLSLFESLGKIPPMVMETSLLQKYKFTNEFLPALLVPRVPPAIPDVRERFIEALDKAGKIPGNILQKYRKECAQKQKEILKNVSIVEDDFDEFMCEIIE